MPGVNPEDVEVTLSDKVLTIRGEMKEDKDIKEENYYLCERQYGSFVRSVTLPMAVDANAIEAVNENGVLTLTLPKAEGRQAEEDRGQEGRGPELSAAQHIHVDKRPSH